LEDGVERSRHENDYLSKLDSDAEGWAESERERELMAVLIEAAHLRSAARAWYRGQASRRDSSGPTGSDRGEHALLGRRES
jgi:hypothetical protein